MQSKSQAECPSFERLRESLTDFVVDVGGHEIKVHKFVMALHSDYLMTMFEQSDMKESFENRVQMDDVDYEIIKALIDFCYTLSIKLTKENVKNILIAANRFQFVAVQDLCINYIKENMDDADCFELAPIAYRCNLSTLSESISSYIAQRFQVIAKEEEFLSLEADVLVRTISRDDLHILDESQIFQAIDEWFRHDEVNRASDLDRLVEHVRFNLFDMCTLVESLDARVTISSESCYHKIRDAMRHVLTRSAISGLPETQAARSSGEQSKIYSFGAGHTNCYDPTEDKWNLIDNSHVEGDIIGAVTIGDFIYVISDVNSTSAEITRINILNGAWSAQRRVFELIPDSVVAHDGRIYVLHTDSTLFERFWPSPRNRIWSNCASPPTNRLNAQLVSLGRYIYLLGGSLATEGTYLSTVERYDPEADEWSEAKPMLSAREKFGCTTFGDKIYVASGDQQNYDSSGEPASVMECYDPAEDEWTQIETIDVRCSQLVEAGGIIHLLSDKSNIVKAYDPTTRKWLSADGGDSQESRVCVSYKSFYAMSDQIGDREKMDEGAEKAV